MKNSPTNRDLYVMIARIEERQIAVAGKMDDFKVTQKEHETEDAKQFEGLHTKLGSMSRYYGAVGTVAGFIGGLVGFAIDYVFNRKP
jgi:hypothetical protein